MSFYLVSIMYLLFDIEICYLFPYVMCHANAQVGAGAGADGGLGGLSWRCRVWVCKFRGWACVKDRHERRLGRWGGGLRCRCGLLGWQSKGWYRHSEFEQQYNVKVREPLQLPAWIRCSPPCILAR